MASNKLVVLSVLAVLVSGFSAYGGTIAPPVGATAVISDDFEGYANSAAFKAVWVPATGSTVDIGAGAGTNGSVGVVSSGGPVVQRNIAPITVKDSAPLTLEADMWDYTSGTSDRNTIGIRSSSLIYEFGEYGSLDDGSNYPGNGVTVQGYGLRVVYGGAPVGSTGQSWWAVTANKVAGSDPNVAYHHIKAVIRGSDVTMTVTLANGNVYSRTVSTTTAATKTLDNIRIGGPSGVSSTDTICIDNVQLYSTPEPASLSLLALGVLGFLRRKARTIC